MTPDEAAKIFKAETATYHNRKEIDTFRHKRLWREDKRYVGWDARGMDGDECGILDLSQLV